MLRLIEGNADLAETASRWPRIVDATAQLEQVSRKLSDVKELFKQVQEQAAVAEKTNATRTIGLFLRKKRDELPNVRTYRHNIGVRQQTMGEGELARLQLVDDRMALANVDLQTQAVLQSLNLRPQNGDRAELEKTVREALKTKSEYLDALIADHDTYFKKLGALTDAEQQLIEAVESCAQYIDQRVLWISGAAPLGSADLRHATDAFWWLTGPRRLARRRPDVGAGRRAKLDPFAPVPAGRGYLSALVLLAAAVPRPHSTDRREGLAGKLLSFPAHARNRVVDRAGGRGLAGADVLSRLAAHRRRRGLGPVQGAGRRTDRDRPGVFRPPTVAAHVRAARTGGVPFRLVGRGVETAAPEHPLVQPAGAALDVRGGGHGLAGERSLGHVAGANLFHRGAAVLCPGSAADSAPARRGVPSHGGGPAGRLDRSFSLRLVSALRADALGAGRSGRGRLPLCEPGNSSRG